MSVPRCERIVWRKLRKLLMGAWGNAPVYISGALPQRPALVIGIALALIMGEPTIQLFR